MAPDPLIQTSRQANQLSDHSQKKKEVAMHKKMCCAEAEIAKQLIRDELSIREKVNLQ